jgi:hypothetical protein
MKNIFGGVLEFGSRSALCRVEVVESSKARGNEIVNIGDKTGGSCRPQDMYARRGVIPSVGIIISVKRVVEFKGKGHWVLWSGIIRLSKCEEKEE